jgi:hypothetical protein
VGYAFINFIDYRAIVSFFKEFNGQRWKNFNSEKVCAISYARIQVRHGTSQRVLVLDLDKGRKKDAML